MPFPRFLSPGGGGTHSSSFLSLLASMLVCGLLFCSLFDIPLCSNRDFLAEQAATAYNDEGFSAGRRYFGEVFSGRSGAAIMPWMLTAEAAVTTADPVTKGVSPGMGGGNKRVSVSEITLDSSVEDIQWCGVDHKTVLLKSKKGKVYRSKDSGKQWIDITDLLAVGLAPSVQITVESILISPVDKNIVLIVGSKRSHFVSEDAANTFRRVQHSATIHSWISHPVRPRHALLSAWTEACFNSNAGGGGCNHLLYITRDLGQSFTLVSSYVVQFSWGDKSRGQEDRIYFTHQRNRQGDQPRTGGWSKFVDFSVTHDSGRTVKLLVSRGNKFLVSNGFIFVAKLAEPSKQTVNMLVCSDGSETFRQARLPEGSVQEKSYTILDTSEGAIMLHVNHGEDGKSNTGNVYISDAEGLRYSLSLPNNVRTMTGECEFDKILSLEGVYIANFKDDLDSNPDATDDEIMQRDKKMLEAAVEDEALETAVDRRRKPKNKGKSEEVVRSVISFDKGGKWSFLVAPKIDSRGKPIDCAPSAAATAAGAGSGSSNANRCWLHLHGITNFHQYAPFYSVENAIGIIMGTGNVGSHLRFEPDEVNTYMSRDGGLTWVEAHKGAFIYEFGDHGGLMVMADDVRKTNQVVFSWNEGQSWYDFELGQVPLDVDNIVIEPNSSSVEFLVYGTTGSAGVVYHLDFAALGQPQCRNVYAADSVSSDYETWTPSDGRSSGAKCSLGREITYTRRKQTSECFNGKDFNRPVIRKNCECTKEDYECEFGFARRVGSLECKPKFNALTNEGCTSASYFYTAAYRKVPGDSCIGGWVPEKVAVPCSSRSPFSRGARMVLMCIVFIAFLMFAVTYVSQSPRLKHLFKNYGFDSFSNVQYGVLGRKGRRKGSEDISLDSAAAASSKYEPELGFIDSEQDEHEDDVPTLLSYTATDFSSESKDSRTSGSSRQQDFPLESTNILDVDDERKVSRRTPATLATEPVPRLSPPPGSSVNLDDSVLEIPFPLP